jgi:TRAP-type C4-dicarboxylate transport system permease large subunit
VMPILLETAALSGAILLIIGAASAMAWSLTQAGFAQTLAGIMGQVPGGRAGFMAVSIVLFIILGSVLEGLPSLVLFGPLLFPLAQQQGINEVQYGIVAILAMGIGLFSPPFGVGFYQTCLIAKSSSDDALGRIWPYMATLVTWWRRSPGYRRVSCRSQRAAGRMITVAVGRRIVMPPPRRDG